MKQITVDTSKLSIVLGDLGGGIMSVRLKEYKETLKGTKAKEMPRGYGSLQVPADRLPLTQRQDREDATIFIADRGDMVVKDKPETLAFSGILTDGTKVRKTYTFYPDAYTVALRFRLKAPGPGDVVCGFRHHVDSRAARVYIFKGPFVYNGRRLQQKDKMPRVAGRCRQLLTIMRGSTRAIFLSYSCPTDREACAPDREGGRYADRPVRFANGRDRQHPLLRA